MNALKQDNTSLKNQINQLKQKIKEMTVSTNSAKGVSTTFKTAAFFARVIKSEDMQAAEPNAQLLENQNEMVSITANSVMTRNVARRLIDVVLEQEDSNQQNDEQDLNLHSYEHDDMQDLVGSDDEDDDEVKSAYKPSIFANEINESLFITSNMVNTHLFCEGQSIQQKNSLNVGQQVTVEPQRLQTSKKR